MGFDYYKGMIKMLKKMIKSKQKKMKAKDINFDLEEAAKVIKIKKVDLIKFKK